MSLSHFCASCISQAIWDRESTSKVTAPPLLWLYIEIKGRGTKEISRDFSGVIWTMDLSSSSDAGCPIYNSQMHFPMREALCGC